MATISMPSFLSNPRSCVFEAEVNQRVNASPFGGSEQVVDLLNDRWSATVSIPPRTKAEGAAVEAFIGAMRGSANIVYLYHLVRPAPRGTMRGSPLCQAASAGADTIVISGLLGDTLVAGDMLGVSGMLLQVAENAVANGSGFITTKLANRLRYSITSGAAVTWDRPLAPFRLRARPAVQYMPGYVEGVTFEFAEYIP